MNDDPLDRFARGGLAPGESRELAQKSLDDPDLFEDLTATSLARTQMPKRRARTAWIPLAGLAAAAAILIALVLVNGLRRPQQPVAHSAPVAGPGVAASGPPIFLARRTDAATPVFRGAPAESRMPRNTGSVASIADGIATVDLGSLDGLVKGGEVEVLRDSKMVGRLRVSTVFRERARAEAPPGLALRVTDQIRVSPPAYLRAVLDQIEAFSARGDAEGARRAAAEAAALEKADVATDGYEDLNNLGGIAELRGDRVSAQSLYERALSANPPAEARQAIDANLTRVKGAK